jgi:hypothetical protein
VSVMRPSSTCTKLHVRRTAEVEALDLSGEGARISQKVLLVLHECDVFPEDIRVLEFSVCSIYEK